MPANTCEVGWGWGGGRRTFQISHFFKLPHQNFFILFKRIMQRHFKDPSRSVLVPFLPRYPEQILNNSLFYTIVNCTGNMTFLGYQTQTCGGRGFLAEDPGNPPRPPSCTVRTLVSLRWVVANTPTENCTLQAISPLPC